jgi:CelD/BcsL family acetyltransferase involved in cellulose biosynthesis
MRGRFAAEESMRQSIEFRREALPPLTELEGEWQRLEAVVRPSFFTSWHWIGTWLEAIPVEGRPELLRGSRDGETVALALLGSRTVRRRHGLIRSRSLFINETGDPLFDALTIEHNGLLCAPADHRAACDALVTWFAQQGAWADELHFGGSLDRLSEPLVADCGLLRGEIAKSSYHVDLERLCGSDGDVGKVLSTNARQQLRRAKRLFERSGPLQLTRAASLAEAHAFFSDMKELHAASWQRRGREHAFSGTFFEPFHRLLIERALAAGAIELWRASAGARLIGYLYNFSFAGRVYAYQSGFAYDDPRARPGVVAHAMAIRQAWRAGAGVYDFLAGSNRLKQSFATHAESMLWQTLQQPRLGFRLEHLGRRLKNAVQARAGGEKAVALIPPNR